MTSSALSVSPNRGLYVARVQLHMELHMERNRRRLWRPCQEALMQQGDHLSRHLAERCRNDDNDDNDYDVDHDAVEHDRDADADADILFDRARA